MPSQSAPARRRSTSHGRRPEAQGGRRARTAPPAPAAVGPVGLRLLPRPGLLGRRLELKQIVQLEVAAALVAVGWSINTMMAAAFAVPALVLVVIALLRLRGRTTGEAVSVRSAYNARRKEAKYNVPPPGTDPAIAPVMELDPALKTCTHAIETDLGDGRPLRRETGMVGDGTFFTSVLLVQSKDQPLRPGRATSAVPLDLICSILQVDDIGLESVQLVQHTQPAPAPHLPEHSLAARAYQQTPGGVSTPALRLTWVALKLDPERAATAVLARGGGEEGARKTLQRVTDQLAGRLNSAGFTATVLDERELIAALAISVCANPVAVAGRQGSGGGGVGVRRAQESSKYCRIDDRWHATYWVSKWPVLSRPGMGGGRVTAPDLVNQLTGTPAFASTFSVTASRAMGGAVALSGHLRLTEHNESRLEQMGRQAESRAQHSGASLTRLDLEHAPGLLATLPLGGTS
ncbi:MULTISPECIES: type VII secretion protein EccE [Kitasatospora]|uniref:Type VII secretion protein EccE n=1 Tax=Kitasatospora cineracea TaxID=88074 RepID=A0A3N4S052_9ACTN|nr:MULTISPECIES: type VII secretion protein EccE [Kitasatospora]ROR38640.1 type VII secretion protein EccE [Kitasatospora cineracea]RPE32370.1 type VII secretion protein EccE [Kitasatospora cineracea]WAL74081.1 type VII secretion protein EccE [Kitasatospora sp. YST-16]WNW40151.1 type VII secretion protein EccE [Streptomyces sp. Li-HN-5-13]